MKWAEWRNILRFLACVLRRRSILEGRGGECGFDVELEVPVEDGALDGITELSTGLVKCWFSGSTPIASDLIDQRGGLRICIFKKCHRWLGCSQSIVV